MTLFEECILALGNNQKIVTEEETNQYFEQLVNMFSIVSWGRIEWETISKKYRLNHISEVLDYLKEHGIEERSIILLWNYSDAPAVKTNLTNIFNCIDDVTAVGSDTFVFCPTGKYVIEFFHEGEITLGII
ncbi:CDI toxin immunity protein [Chengkuizengella marina]|uniref:Uncharacterized protein n=1 Tax=Chengkuizengella marina TaxID=2507566 RepID=A0A6N9Q796_9BACL|nr:hypothetical protein [Chengkuizengella marina]NBI30728.1 hypothetical protein [Chengkuizengella marina]